LVPGKGGREELRACVGGGDRSWERADMVVVVVMVF